MKKLVVLGIVMSLSFAVVGCTGADNNVKNNVQVENQGVDSDDSTIQEKEEKFIYGKVKSIVGNEIEIEIAKEPNVEIESTIGDDEIVKNDQGEIPAVMTTPSTEATQEEIDKKVPTGKIEKNEPLVELEFINEFKTIIVPTGAKVNILTGRSGDGLSAIKEGVYLKISVDDNTVDNPNVDYIDVIS